MQADFHCIHGSSLATVFLRKASSLLELAGDDRETVLHARLVYFDVIEQPDKHFLDLHSKYKFGFESWCLPPYFDPENPEFLIRRLDEGIGNTEFLLEGDLEGSFDWWDVTETHGSAAEVELPAEVLGRFTQEIGWLREGEIEEYCAQGGGIPFFLSDGVKALYLKYVRSYGANDNLDYPI